MMYVDFQYNHVLNGFPGIPQSVSRVERRTSFSRGFMSPGCIDILQERGTRYGESVSTGSWFIGAPPQNKNPLTCIEIDVIG